MSHKVKEACRFKIHIPCRNGKRRGKRSDGAAVCLMMSAIILLQCLPTVTLAAKAEDAPTDTQTVFEREIDYLDYLSSHADKPYPEAVIPLGAEQCEAVENAKVDVEANGREHTVCIDETGAVSYRFAVEKSGLYFLQIVYSPLSKRATDIELKATVNGSVPFRQAASLLLNKQWKTSETRRQDNNGNDLQPSQVCDIVWITEFIRDRNGKSDDYFAFYLEAGECDFRLQAMRDSLAIEKVQFMQIEEYPTYEEYKARHAAAQIAGDYEFVRHAEDCSATSHSMIYPSAHRGSASVDPCDPRLIKINVIGLNSWDLPGQWISWEIDIPYEGLYQLTFKYRQNKVRGFPVSRRLTIDGAVPFDEANAIKFDYTSGQKWNNQVLSDENGNPYMFYFEKPGKHTIRLEVVMADIGPMLRRVSDIVSRLNEVYRKIVAVTGTVPDPYRDYYLEDDIPDLLETFRSIADEISDLQADFERMAKGDKGNQVAFLDDIVRQLNSFCEKPQTIQTRLNQFKNNISSLADLQLTLANQPLELDYLVVHGVNYTPQNANAGFFKTVSFRFQAFIASFFIDYSAIGNTYTEGDLKQDPIDVWVSVNDLATTGYASGRDQMMVVKKLIDNEFTSNKRIPVNLRLVDSASTLTQAVLSKRGPDVAMIVPSTTPINLAMRGALMDLSKMQGFKEVKKDFFSSAFIPYEWEGGVYGMPETQVFMMLFYRKDILAENGLEVPETWESFYKTANKLMRNNLQVGVPESLQIFETILLQQGGSIYTPDQTGTALDTPQAISAFKEWTELYSLYSFPMYFDALSRFRTGEMPIVFSQYTFYNQLIVAAPELSGLWDMAPLPGRMLNGELTSVSSSTGTCSILLKDAKSPENCFEFIKWWVSADVQSAFGQEIENSMGPTARYNTANINAFRNLPWTADEQEKIMSQWKSVSAIPNAPGSYYVSRCLTNAFRNVVMKSTNPTETLNRYNVQINNEIRRKRNELGLPVD